jgi:hypothetical protein
MEDSNRRIDEAIWAPAGIPNLSTINQTMKKQTDLNKYFSFIIN